MPRLPSHQRSRHGDHPLLPRRGRRDGLIRGHSLPFGDHERTAGAYAPQTLAGALDREQRVSSLGALAAAAAHELGSPLGTISLVAKELARVLESREPQLITAEYRVAKRPKGRVLVY